MAQLHAHPKYVCEGCILGEIQCASFPKDGLVRTTHKLQFLCNDVGGAMQIPSLEDYLYFVTFVDDYFGHAWVYPLKAKSEVFLCFEQFIVMVENVSRCKVGTLHYDQGGKYMSKGFNAFWVERGIKHQCKMSYTPQQNDVVERKMGLLWRRHDVW